MRYVDEGLKHSADEIERGSAMMREYLVAVGFTTRNGSDREDFHGVDAVTTPPAAVRWGLRVRHRKYAHLVARGEFTVRDTVPWSRDEGMWLRSQYRGSASEYAKLRHGGLWADAMVYAAGNPFIEGMVLDWAPIQRGVRAGIAPTSYWDNRDGTHMLVFNTRQFVHHGDPVLYRYSDQLALL